MNADTHIFLFLAHILFVSFQSVKNCGKLVAQEHRNNGRWGFICAQAVVVTCACNRDTEQILILVNRLDNGTKEQKELCIFAWRFARLQQVSACVCGKGPVVMLTATVHTCKWLFVEQANKAVLLCHSLHKLHCELVVVGC